MTVRYFALVLGIIFLLIGVLGFFPAFYTQPPAGAPHLAVDVNHGWLLGLFPVNILHNIFHVVFGIWGIAAYRTFSAARLYSKVTAVVYGILVIMGLFPVLNTFFGLIPLHGHDIWLHALIALAAAYFGYLVPSEADERRWRTASDRNY